VAPVLSNPSSRNCLADSIATSLHVHVSVCRCHCRISLDPTSRQTQQPLPLPTRSTCYLRLWLPDAMLAVASSARLATYPSASAHRAPIATRRTTGDGRQRAIRVPAGWLLGGSIEPRGTALRAADAEQQAKPDGAHAAASIDRIVDMFGHVSLHHQPHVHHHKMKATVGQTDVCSQPPELSRAGQQ
jgi:hypothetical protein